MSIRFIYKAQAQRVRPVESHGFDLKGWPPLLKDGAAIADHIIDTAVKPKNRTYLKNRYEGCVGRLQVVPIDSIREGPRKRNRRHPERERRYRRMDPATVPPIVVRHGVVQDGNHRLRVFRQRGIDCIPAYMVGRKVA